MTCTFFFTRIHRSALNQCSLDPDGLLGVVDFYTSSRASTSLERAIGNGNERRTGFFSRWFWQIWYET